MSLYERTATFEYDDYPGLEVVMRVTVPVRRYLEIVAFLDAVKLDAESMEKVAEIVDEFLVSWTLRGDALDQPLELLVGIVRAWLRGVRDVPVPLPRRSSDTGPSPEPSASPSS